MSAPKWTAVCSFSSSPSMSLVTAELPMLALILRAGGDADAHRLQPLLEMDLVGGNDHPAAGDFVANQLRLEPLAAGDEFHLRRDPAGAGLFDLGHGASQCERLRRDAGNNEAWVALWASTHPIASRRIVNSRGMDHKFT